MPLNYNWVPFFSQSGSEIFNIIAHTQTLPTAIITNRQNDEGLNLYLKNEKEKGLKWVTLPEKPELVDYEKALEGIENPLITLHGYLRIIPKEICKKYKMYNLHPGLITEYPDLKGKDPQVRAVRAGYKTAGAVIHKVTPIVDDGEVVQSHAINIINFSEERVIQELHCLGSIMW